MTLQEAINDTRFVIKWLRQGGVYQSSAVERWTPSTATLRWVPASGCPSYVLAEREV